MKKIYKRPSNIYNRQNTGEVQFHRVHRSKYVANDLSVKKTNRSVIDVVENEHKTKTARKPTKVVPDFSMSVPQSVRTRLSKIIKITPVEKALFEEEKEIALDEMMKKRKLIIDPDDELLREEETLEHEMFDIGAPALSQLDGPELTRRPDKSDLFNESTASNIQEEERAFVNIVLRVEPKPLPRTQRPADKGWISGYFKKKKLERVKWATKVYQLERKLLEKQMFDQAEELIDMAAGDFSEWINSLSSDSRTNISKNLIKELFPIRLEGDASKTLYVEPKLITAVPEEVGRKWNLPELTLENNVINLMNEGKRRLRKQSKRIAFGCTLPVDLQVKKMIQDEMDRQSMKIDFPDELKSKKVMFQGIHHLRSTKAIIQYLIDHPEVPKPTFLKRSGFFKVTMDKDATSSTPLYEHFI